MPQPRGEPGRAGEGSGVPGLHLPGSPRQPSSVQATSDQAGHSAESGSPAARPAAGRRPRPPPPARLRRQRQEEQQEQQQPVPLQPSPPPREQQQQQPQQQQEPSPLLPRTAPTPATAALATCAAAEEQQEQQAGPRKRQRRAAAPRRGMFAAMAAGVEHEQLDGASEEEGDEGEEDEEEDEGGGSFRGPAGRGRGVRQAKRRVVAPRTRLPAQGAPSGAAGGSTSLHQPGAATYVSLVFHPHALQPVMQQCRTFQPPASRSPAGISVRPLQPSASGAYTRAQRTFTKANSSCSMCVACERSRPQAP